jgi:replication initiation protein RepC
VKHLNRALFEAGIFVIRDNPQGKRYGRRGPDGRILEAYGFDLSPLALRYDEFVATAAAARVERERKRALRRRITLARRAITQVGAALADLDAVPEGWACLATEAADLVTAARRAERTDDLALAAKGLERRQGEAEQWLRDAAKPVETSPTGLENEPHTITTNLSENLKDTVIANEGSSPPQPPVPPSPSPVALVPAEREFRLKAGQLLDLMPRLAAHILTDSPTWRDIVDAAGDGLRIELGVSPSLWGDACRVMGREKAALALAIVSTKPPEHFTRGAGGYFAGMVRKDERGELRLERTLWALKDRKWGANKRSREDWKVTGDAGSYGYLRRRLLN